MAERRGVSTSESRRLWCVRKRGMGRRECFPRRTAAASTSAGGGMVWNEQGNLVNMREHGEHEHQCLT